MDDYESYLSLSGFGPEDSSRNPLRVAEGGVRSVGKRVTDRLPQLLMNSVLFGAFSMLIPLLVLTVVYRRKLPLPRAVVGGACFFMYGLAVLQWGLEIYTLVLNVLGSLAVREATIQCLDDTIRGATCTLSPDGIDQLLDSSLQLYPRIPAMPLAATLIFGNMANSILAYDLLRGESAMQRFIALLFSVTTIVAGLSLNNASASRTYAITHDLFATFILSWALNVWIGGLTIYKARHSACPRPAGSRQALLHKLHIAAAALHSVLWTVLVYGVIFARYRASSMSSTSWYCALGIHLFISSGFVHFTGIYITTQFLLVVYADDEVQDGISAANLEDASDVLQEVL
ncbi:uncharacterized protein PHACADRAFT_207971 [Phanerochaete carnosa HHB-10118-sp]|uniref:Uncharacterized protein n=1 Tax=Phanerochaete carnosa (strain HHB-10118-sp) TaxID=650164 RepID=K5X1W7_PHACS|nr:uncharacterized protein PHACADRAFT_207971 [Phanerochaete carnosa HHB-10118-sp]EKM56777.1 hypothetical protein PHACADRAFT_207971 [Phanerochaete carnosa HHB-10118-sp]